MLSSSSVWTDKNTIVALNYYKVLKLKFQAFAAQQHNQGWIYVPDDAVELGKLRLLVLALYGSLRPYWYFYPFTVVFACFIDVYVQLIVADCSEPGHFQYSSWCLPFI